MQHPGGGVKTLAQGPLRSHSSWSHDGSKKGDLTYQVDTLRGSSGSPVFNHHMTLIGIHHSRDKYGRDHNNYCGTSVVAIIDRLAGQ